ncbi:MAG: NADH-quinone oxidoreductase subunit H, partial [Planctomycetes bacterium]|nr:NADH-quinone oxidoreductase subunit H [Planctomycetota bacterium]
DKPLFILAPAISMVVALIGFVVIPWGGFYMLGDTRLNVQVANPDIGLLYILGVGSMGVYGVVLGGWASNNKYSMYGAVRATAQMLSYEIPMGVAILVVVLTCGELRLEEIVLAQLGEGRVWNILLQPVAFLILLTTLFAETNRAPFDLAEAEQELVGGFHTEYSSMKFAMFFLGEYVHMITGSAFICVLFLGGWDLSLFGLTGSCPGTSAESMGLIAVLLKIGVMSVKVAFFIFLFMLIRWTLPRFRFDQLMRVAWKGLIPLSLGVLVLTVAGVYLGYQHSLLFNLAGNAAIIAVTLAVVTVSNKPLSGRQDNLPVIRQPQHG